jgi:hypothetical protein
VTKARASVLGEDYCGLRRMTISQFKSILTHAYRGIVHLDEMCRATPVETDHRFLPLFPVYLLSFCRGGLIQRNMRL